jgi:hypothetical protein
VHEAFLPTFGSLAMFTPFKYRWKVSVNEWPKYSGISRDANT